MIVKKKKAITILLLFMFIILSTACNNTKHVYKDVETTQQETTEAADILEEAIKQLEELDSILSN